MDVLSEGNYLYRIRYDCNLAFPQNADRKLHKMCTQLLVVCKVQMQNTTSKSHIFSAIIDIHVYIHRLSCVFFTQYCFSMRFSVHWWIWIIITSSLTHCMTSRPYLLLGLSLSCICSLTTLKVKAINNTVVILHSCIRLCLLESNTHRRFEHNLTRTRRDNTTLSFIFLTPQRP